jgi:hypothetical protein
LLVHCGFLEWLEFLDKLLDNLHKSLKILDFYKDGKSDQMATYITLNNNIILAASKSTIAIIHDFISDYLEEKDISISDNFNNLTVQLFIATGGLGFDIATILIDFKDVIFFADLLKQSINKYDRDYKSLASESPEFKIRYEIIIKKLWNFHKEIEEYAKILKNKEVQQS